MHKRTLHNRVKHLIQTQTFYGKQRKWEKYNLNMILHDDIRSNVVSETRQL